MIEKLRRRFILITMLSLLAMFLILIAAINIVNIHNQARESDMRLAMIAKNGGQMPLPEKLVVNRDMAAGPKERGRTGNLLDWFGNFSEPAVFGQRYFTVQYDESGAVAAMYASDGTEISAEDATAYADAVKNKKKISGWYGNFRYGRFAGDGGEMFVFADASVSFAAIRSVLLTSSTVLLFCYGVVLLLVVALSKRVVRPFAENWFKQRQFVTDAGHELKTPLTIISANTALAEMTYGESEWFEGIQEQTERMTGLVHNLVALARMDEEAPRRKMADFCLSDAVEDTVTAFFSLAESRGKHLTAEIEPDLVYYGDEAAIREMVSILLDNAVKYSDDGGQIQLSLKRQRHIWLSLCNSCAGVADLPLKQLFDRFFRADAARSGNIGYGLGLAIAKSICEAHKGMIEARATDAGTIEFRVKL